MEETHKNEFWMSSLPDELRYYAITNLALPGTHESMTYKMTSMPSTEINKHLRNINFLWPDYVRRFSKTQTLNVIEQLRLGVRYLSFTITQHDKQPHFSNTLLCSAIYEPLRAIKNFLLTHRNEIVILDFNRFHGLSVEHHKQLQDWLLNLFGTLLYGQDDGTLTECTILRCTTMWKQVILIYRHGSVPLPNEFWSGTAVTICNTEVTKLKQLRGALTESLKSRNDMQGHVSPCIVKPSKTFMIFRCYSSLQKIAEKVNKDMVPWIMEQEPGSMTMLKMPAGVNILTADFVDIGEFCDAIIDLNYKLARYSIFKRTTRTTREYE